VRYQDSEPLVVAAVSSGTVALQRAVGASNGLQSRMGGLGRCGVAEHALDRLTPTPSTGS
jgi:hypothetical protein